MALLVGLIVDTISSIGNILFLKTRRHHRIVSFWNGAWVTDISFQPCCNISSLSPLSSIFCETASIKGRTYSMIEFREKFKKIEHSQTITSSISSSNTFPHPCWFASSWGWRRWGRRQWGRWRRRHRRSPGSPRSSLPPERLDSHKDRSSCCRSIKERNNGVFVRILCNHPSGKPWTSPWLRWLSGWMAGFILLSDCGRMIHESSQWPKSSLIITNVTIWVENPDLKKKKTPFAPTNPLSPSIFFSLDVCCARET